MGTGVPNGETPMVTRGSDRCAGTLRASKKRSGHEASQRGGTHATRHGKNTDTLKLSALRINVPTRDANARMHVHLFSRSHFILLFFSCNIALTTSSANFCIIALATGTREET